MARVDRKLTRKDLSEDMVKRLHDAMMDTYQTIGYDLEQARASSGTEDEMSAEELAEVILDANYLEMYGGDDEAVGLLRQLTFSESDAFALDWAEKVV